MHCQHAGRGTHLLGEGDAPSQVVPREARAKVSRPSVSPLLRPLSACEEPRRGERPRRPLASCKRGGAQAGVLRAGLGSLRPCDAWNTAPCARRCTDQGARVGLSGDGADDLRRAAGLRRVDADAGRARADGERDAPTAWVALRVRIGGAFGLSCAVIEAPLLIR